jgi:hypothetical protein
MRQNRVEFSRGLAKVGGQAVRYVILFIIGEYKGCRGAGLALF